MKHILIKEPDQGILNHYKEMYEELRGPTLWQDFYDKMWSVGKQVLMDQYRKEVLKDDN